MRNRLFGKAQTVLGPIYGDELGITLPHEHLIADLSSDFLDPPTASDRFLARQSVSLENLRWVRYNSRYSIDNQKLLDEQRAIKELMLFMIAGGKTVVELTSIGLGRDPMALARVSRATGINVIMGAGYFEADSLSPEIEEKTEEEMADEIILDITKGVGGTGIRAGIIGEVGCTWPIKDIERKSLWAAAHAQKRTNAAINVHPNRNERGPIEAIEILRNAGAHLNRVVISHMDRCGYSLETRLRILEAGCYVEYDSFGTEGYYPAEAALADDHLPDQPNDIGRIKEIAELIDLGYLRQILISQDTCQKNNACLLGGPWLCPYLGKCNTTNADLWLQR